jgi:hypothetical protein
MDDDKTLTGRKALRIATRMIREKEREKNQASIAARKEQSLRDKQKNKSLKAAAQIAKTTGSSSPGGEMVQSVA